MIPFFLMNRAAHKPFCCLSCQFADTRKMWFTRARIAVHAKMHIIQSV